MYNLNDGYVIGRQMRRDANVTAIRGIFQMSMCWRRGCDGHAQHRRDCENHGNYAKSAGRTRFRTQHLF
jgi:hypothetical protein